MSLRSALTRLAIVTAAGALAASAAVAPALADGGDGVHAQQGGTNDWQNEGGEGDDWRPGGGDGGGGGDGWQSGGGDQWQSGGNQNGAQSGNQWQSGGNQSGSQNGKPNSHQSGNQWQSGGSHNGGQSGGSQWQSGGDQSGSHQSGAQSDNRRSRGRVTASELLLRSAPTRASQVIRVVHRGDIVSIFCRTSGQNVQGNTHWYLLTDGTWAWGSARYIETIGAAPRWC
jgi:hypothetical protein